MDKRAATAPVSGQGLGSTIWKACAWWAIRCFLVGRGSIRERRRTPESWRPQLLIVSTRIASPLLKKRQLVLGGEAQKRL